MEITRENQIKIIDEGLKRLGITNADLERLAKLTSGTLKDFRRGRTSVIRADKWQRICLALKIPAGANQGQMYKINEDLLAQCLDAVQKVSQRHRAKYTQKQIFDKAIALYNHVMEYRTQGEEAVPNEAMADLLINRSS